MAKGVGGDDGEMEVEVSDSGVVDLIVIGPTISLGSSLTGDLFFLPSGGCVQSDPNSK